MCFSCAEKWTCNNNVFYEERVGFLCLKRSRYQPLPARCFYLSSSPAAQDTFNSSQIEVVRGSITLEMVRCGFAHVCVSCMHL